MKISVVLPVYDETDSVRALVTALHQLIPDRLHQVVLVLAPKSSEASFAVARELLATYSDTELYVQQEVPGVGRAYREGYRRVTGTHVLMMDSDGEMQPETVPRLVATMERSGADVVIAARWAPGGGALNYPRLKYVLNRSYQYLFRGLLFTSLADLTFGFKLMRREVVDSIEWSACFQDIGAETTMYPLRAGFRIAQVPTVWKGREGVSQHSLSLARNLLYVRAAARALLLGRRLRRT
jgi:dolichol-phosphate mannosyltransferase